jgi:C-terminal processing protease CtpA/Prc
MRKLVILIVFASLTACGGSDGGTVVPQTGTDACSVDGQKQFVLDNLYAWYLWNQLLPAGLDIADYATPEELISQVTQQYGPQDANGNPLDRFSFVNSAEADAQFFGEGRFEGFGFSWRFVDPGQTEFRITRNFEGSPADLGGLERGVRVVSLNTRSVGEIAASEGISAFFDANDTVTFEIEPLVGATFTSDITKDIVTINPVPRWEVIDAGNGRNVGYMELSTFISTADPVFDTVFQAFRNANVNDVIVDLRYNGGGLVSTAELLGDYLGGSVAQSLVFSNTEFNADRGPAYNSTEMFQLLSNSISLSTMVVIASRGTASASELVTNGLIPHVDVAIVGDTTFGKPVGQIGLEFCDKLMRPTAFRLENSLGDGDYFDGLPLTPGCAAADDLSIPVGDPLDPNMVAAMGYLDTGSCPVVTLPPGVQKPTLSGSVPVAPRQGPPHRELLGAE